MSEAHAPRRAGRLARRLVLGVAAVAVSLPLRSTVQAQPDVEPVLTRASSFAEAFFKDFTALMGEERYEQTIRPAEKWSATSRLFSRGQQKVTLRSDFLLVKLADGAWRPFRDVYERDGKAVRDRQARLAALFSEGPLRTAVEQADAITRESTRHNIGNVERNVNVPTMPMLLLLPEVRPRLRFTIGQPDEAGTVLEFAETARPTLIRTLNDLDLPISGKYVMDEKTGAIVRTEVRATHPTVEAVISVTYEYDRAVKGWVPVRMEERYRGRNDPSEVSGRASYSKFRRFVVTTTIEPLTPPAPAR